jgi:dihydrolipoamide dehydrogenase
VYLHPDGELLPGVPRDLVRPIERALKKTLAGIGPVDEAGDHAGLVVDARQGVPDLSGLDLPVTQAVLDGSGWIDVSDTMQTSDTRILAAGRCTGRSVWAGAALRMGAVAASTLLEGHDAWDPVVEPRTTWCAPGLAWCGPDSLDGLQTITVPWGHSGQAVLRGVASAGQTLLAWEAQSGIVVGAGAVGEGATEQAEAFTLAIELGATLEDLAACVPGHPTRAELLGVAAQKALS